MPVSLQARAGDKAGEGAKQEVANAKAARPGKKKVQLQAARRQAFLTSGSHTIIILMLRCARWPLLQAMAGAGGKASL